MSRFPRAAPDTMEKKSTHLLPQTTVATGPPATRAMGLMPPHLVSWGVALGRCPRATPPRPCHHLPLEGLCTPTVPTTARGIGTAWSIITRNIGRARMECPPPAPRTLHPRRRLPLETVSWPRRSTLTIADPCPHLPRLRLLITLGIAAPCGGHRMRRCRPPITATPTIAPDFRRRPGCLLTESRGRPTRNGCPRRRPPPATLIEHGSVKVRIGLEADSCSNVSREKSPTATRRCKRQRVARLRSDSWKEVQMRWLWGEGQLAGCTSALFTNLSRRFICVICFFFSGSSFDCVATRRSLPSDVRDAFVSSSGGVRCVLPATFTGGRQSRTSTFWFFPFNFGTVLYSHSPHPKLS